jgi:hypothetical protein
MCYDESNMHERSYQFTPREGDRNNQGVFGEAEFFEREQDSYSELRPEGELVVLSDTALEKLDQAMNVAGLLPVDLGEVDGGTLQSVFQELNKNVGTELEKPTLKKIIALVRAAV